MVLTGRGATFAVFAVALVSLVGATAAQAFGTFTPAGNYRSHSVNASLFLFGGSPNFNLNVSQTTSVSNPLVGPSSSTNETDVSFNVCDTSNNVCGGGCFITGPSDFTASADLSSAALSATFTQGISQPCQGNPVNFFLPSPPPTTFTLSAKWVNGGSVGLSRTVSRFSCDGYTSETMSTNNNPTNVTASAQISLLPADSFGSTGASLYTSDQNLHTQGTADPSCNQLGLKGAGSGPLGVGNFRFSNRSASVQLPNGMSLSLFSFSNTLTPRGSGPTTQVETDLTFTEFVFPFGFAQSCFVLGPTAFTISNSGASVVTVIDSTATPCTDGPGNNLTLPDTVHVDVSWTSSGMLATLRRDGTFACNGTLNSASSSVQTFVNAGTSGSVPELGGSVDGLQGGVGSNDSAFHLLTAAQC